MCFHTLRVLLPILFPPQIQHKTLQSRERNGIEHNNKQFNMHITEYKKQIKYMMCKWPFGNKVWQEENKFV